LPRTADLITVPACLPCNQIATLDDEYLRLVFTVGSSEDSAAQEVLDRHVLPRLSKQQGFLRAFLRGGIPRVEVRSPGGVLLGHSPGFLINRPRLQRCIGKIVRGLFYHHYGRPLPLRYLVEDYRMDPNFPDEFKREIARLPLIEIGGGVFGYRFLVSPDEPEIGFWFLMFYRSRLITTQTLLAAGNRILASV